MNYSKQRQMIIEEVCRTKTHPTTEMIYTNLRTKLPNLSLATVYRNLNLLCETGRLKRISLPESPDRFDADITFHAHLYCESCRSVIDLHEFDDQVTSLISHRTDHIFNSATLVIRGICGRCNKEPKKPIL